MNYCRPDNRVSLPRSLGTSKIYTKGCSFSYRLLPLLFALKDVRRCSGQSLRMEVAP